MISKAFYLVTLLLCVILTASSMPSRLLEVCRAILSTHSSFVRIDENRSKHAIRCQSGFTMYGARKSRCTIFNTWDPKLPMCIKPGCTKPHLLPNGSIHDVDFEGMENAIVSFSCNRGYRRLGLDRLFCNGTSWNGEPPRCVRFKFGNFPEGQKDKSTDRKLRCTFEDPFLCGWSQDNDDDFDWSRISGRGDIDPTMPRPLLTNLQTYSVIVYSPNLQEKANLISMTFAPEFSKSRCMSFKYRMFGSNYSELSIFLKPDGIKTSDMIPKHRIFHASGSKVNDWLTHRMQLPKQIHQFNIVLQGTPAGAAAHIGVTNIIFVKCNFRRKSQYCLEADAVEGSGPQHTSIKTLENLRQERRKERNEKRKTYRCRKQRKKLKPSFL